MTAPKRGRGRPRLPEGTPRARSPSGTRQPESAYLERGIVQLHARIPAACKAQLEVWAESDGSIRAVIERLVRLGLEYEARQFELELS